MLVVHRGFVLSPIPKALNELSEICFIHLLFPIYEHGVHTVGIGLSY